MTAKEFCKSTAPIALNSRGLNECVYIHGIEHGLHDVVYISHVIGSMVKYHKLRINHGADRAYIILQELRIYLDDFIDLGN